MFRMLDGDVYNGGDGQVEFVIDGYRHQDDEELEFFLLRNVSLQENAYFCNKIILIY